ncbi:MAG: PQQ-like beta-propeller repeat protein [Phycisphaerales bacterium]|nr:MAG: PQQ-like beta-propeller repeat protein [Phycisphaerales bacterium]
MNSQTLRNRVLCLVVCAIVAGQCGFCLAADWPNYRGPNYNGFTSETDWSTNWGPDGPKQLWKKSVGIGFSSIVVSNGRAYTMGNKGRREATDVVFCLDAGTGAEVWTHEYDCPLEPKWYEGGTLATPTVDGDVVYTISKKGHLFCFDAATGTVKWQKNMNKDYGFKLPTWHFSSSGLVVGDMLIFNIGTAGVALDKKNGNIIWENGKDVCGYATPVSYTMAGQKCLAIFGADALKAVNLADGKLLWQYPFVNQHKVNAADPIISGDSIFMSSGYNRGCAKIRIVDNQPEVLWDNEVMRNHMNCTMLWKGYLYGFDESQLRCLDFKDCSIKWKQDGLGKGSLMMSTDGRMIIMTDKGELVIAEASPEGFKQIARAQILPKSKSWTTPTLSGGKIYARNAKGDMVCVDVGG